MMTIEKFQYIISEGQPLEGDEMIEFMREQSDESRRLQIELNCKYNTPQEIRDIFSRIIGEKVDESFRMFPPFYTDFGKNIHIGKTCSSIPTVSFKIKAAYLSAMVHLSGTVLS